MSAHGRLALAALGAALVWPQAALAWGQKGHEITCDLAYRSLSPAGRALVDEIRHEAVAESSGRFDRLCSWADYARNASYRGTYEYHFVNVKDGAPALDFARDCAALDCTPVAIQRYATVVARDPGGSARKRDERLRALKFLAHFVADLHQPLHVGQTADRGGNRIRVGFFGNFGPADRPLDLHKVWDTELLERALAGGWDPWPALQAADTAAWLDLDPIGWAAESYALARTHAYRHPSGATVKNGHDLGSGYADAALPVVEEQILRGAARLAHLLDALASGSAPRNMVLGVKP